MFEHYFQGTTYDEMFDPQHRVRSHWEVLKNNLEDIGIDQLNAKQKEIDWCLEENGVTYNVYNNPEGMNRPWKLDPIPLVIDEVEWNEIEKGLKQRSRLLNLLLQDIYGEQRVIKEGIIPMEVVYAHSGFVREAFSMPMRLSLYAADMARGPDGKMWIVNDRTQAPSGLGYAIENRLTMNAAMEEAYHGLSVRRLFEFFETFKTFLEEAGDTEGLNVLLTPGPHNETYFEHAYLSSFLGLTLVQGQDLMAKNGSLWLKSLNGLHRIHSIIRRVDENFCDPLELRSDSQLGVAGLMQILRSNGVSMINPIGCGVLENPALNPFMPRLSEFFLGEALCMPQIATWWCGQEAERNYVLDHLNELIVKTIDRNDNHHIVNTKNLSPQEKEHLVGQIMEFPYRYVGQEVVKFATSPSLEGGDIRSLRTIIRVFSLSHDDEVSVMPGGLVRVGSTENLLSISNQNGGSSKDLWVLGPARHTPLSKLFASHTPIGYSFETMPSLRAENLFWQGRYLVRSIISARLIRTVLKSITNTSRYEQRNGSVLTQILTRTLTHVTMTYPGFLGEVASSRTFSEIWSVVSDHSRVGSLSQALMMLSNTNTATRNLLPLEAWRIHERMMSEWERFCREEKPIPRYMVHMLDKLLTHLMAYKELIQESLFIDQGSLIYEIGTRIERSQLMISKARSLLVPLMDPLEEYETLEVFLASCESLNAYRARYRTTYDIRNVIEFLLLDIRFPKSLIAELDALSKLFPLLPKYQNTLDDNPYERALFEAYNGLSLSSLDELTACADGEYVRTMLDRLLSELSDKLMAVSNEFTKTYFTHYGE